MSASYCMKNCDECTSKCGGCRTSAYVERCEIAKCCRERGHRSCEDCLTRPGCRKCMGSSRMPESMILKERREREILQGNFKRAGILAHWVKVIFWCWIAQIVTGLLDLDFITQALPVVGFISFAVTTVLMTAVGFSYLEMKEIDDRFGYVGYAQLAVAVYSVLDRFLPEGNILMNLLMFAAAVVNVISLNWMCTAYSDTLEGISPDFSEKWLSLWTWYLYTLCGILGGIVLLIIPFLSMIGVIVIIGALIMLIVVSIRQGICLYQTANVCAEYHELGN